EVARKRANKAVSTAAEPVERRGGTKENADLQSTVRTQSREAVSQAQARIREAVTRNRQDKLTALLHHINVDVLPATFFGLKKSAAPGGDEMKAQQERFGGCCSLLRGGPATDGAYGAGEDARAASSAHAAPRARPADPTAYTGHQCTTLASGRARHRCGTRL